MDTQAFTRTTIQTQPATCHFCDRPVFSTAISPMLCEKHLTLVLIRFVIERRGLKFTVASAEREYQRQRQVLGGTFQQAELPELINQMTPEDYRPA